jgi:hypothetical protein
MWWLHVRSCLLERICHLGSQDRETEEGERHELEPKPTGR